MPTDVRFALVREPLNPHAKPVAMSALGELARAIHADRQGAAIKLDNAPLKVQGWPEELQGVSITTLTDDGSPHRYIGWAWLDGSDWGGLQRALERLASTAPTIGRRAA